MALSKIFNGLVFRRVVDRNDDYRALRCSILSWGRIYLDPAKSNPRATWGGIGRRLEIIFTFFEKRLDRRTANCIFQHSFAGNDRQLFFRDYQPENVWEEINF